MSSNWFNKNPIKTLVFTVLVLLVLITFGAEKILQYKNQGIGFHYNLPHRAIRLREYRPLLTEWLEAGKQDAYYDTLVAKKYRLRIDNDGFIEPSKKYTNPDMSIVFLGGSTTECRYTDEEHRFPYLAGVLLEQQTGLKINSYNSGKSGNHSLHSLDILINKLFPLNPDIVVMLDNINDLIILLYESSYWNPKSSRSVIIDINKEIDANFFKMFRDKYIPNLAIAMHKFDNSLRLLWKPKKTGDDEFAHIRGKKVTIDKSAMVEQFEMNLQSFIYLCKARKIIPVIMTMPSRFKEKPDQIIWDSINDTGVDYSQFRQLFLLFNNAILKKAHENDIMVIDLANEIPQENEFMYDSVHYTDKGSRKIADIISDRLQPVVYSRIKTRNLQVH